MPEPARSGAAQPPVRRPDTGHYEGQDKQDHAGQFGSRGHGIHRICVTFNIQEQLEITTR